MLRTAAAALSFNAHICDVFAAFPGKRNLLNYSSSSLALSISPHNHHHHHPCPVKTPPSGSEPSALWSTSVPETWPCVFFKNSKKVFHAGGVHVTTPSSPPPQLPWHVTMGREVCFLRCCTAEPQQYRNQQPASKLLVWD